MSNIKNYVSSLQKVLQPNLRIAGATSAGINDLVQDWVKHIAAKAVRQAERKKSQTVTTSILTATVDPATYGALAKQAQADGVAAVTKYNQYQPKKGVRVSRSDKSGLTLPVSRIGHLLRESVGSYRLSSTADVYLTGVVESVVANLLESASSFTQAANRKTITPEDVTGALAISEGLQGVFYKYILDHLNDPSNIELLAKAHNIKLAKAGRKSPAKKATKKSPKKKAAKKGAKKAGAKKAGAKKAGAKKAGAKKTTPKKSPAKKTTPKKSPAKKTTPKRA